MCAAPLSRPWPSLRGKGSDPDLAAALAGRPEFSGPWQALELPSFTNRVFRVATAQGDFVVRLAGAETAHFIDRAAEAHNHRIAAKIGVAPALLHADAALSILQALPDAEMLTPATARQPANIVAVGAALARLHREAAPFRGRQRLFATMERYLAKAGAAAPATLRQAWASLADERAALDPEDGPLVSSHIDPNADNFLWSGNRLWLVDWEYSALAPPLWDLADFAAAVDLPPPARTPLLTAYGLAEGSDLSQRFRLHMRAHHLLAAGWAAMQAALRPAEADSFRALQEARLARAMGADLT